ncbi:MAG: PH domain-containing protein [Planctomycetes bacterium]|nr:PH domain-containing protein [Planctomycetota bacterium]
MSSHSARFSARWSGLVWLITVVVLAVVLAAEAILLTQAIRGSAEDTSGRVLYFLLMLVPLGIFGKTASLAPRYYTVGPEGVTVRRFGSDVLIERTQIREIRRIDSPEIGFVWRVFGSGGFFGWFGWFRSRSLGRFTAYATNRRDLILITKTDGSKLILSPYPRDAFLKSAPSIVP